MIDISSDYASGSITEAEFMKSFMAYFTVDSMKADSLTFDDTAVYSFDENKIKMIKPWSMNINVRADIKYLSLYVCPENGHTVLSHSKGFILLDKGGSPVSEFTIPAKEKKSFVKGAAVINGDVIYYSGSRLFKHPASAEKSEPLLKEDFKPVYEKFFDVKFSEPSNTLFFAYGSAGSYKISGINLTKNNLIIKDLTSASSRYYFNENEGMFLTGSTGDWTLTHITFPDKIRKNIYKFTDLREIVLFKDGYIFQTSKGFFIGSGTDKPEWTGFQWILAGKYRNYAVIKIGSEYIFADSAKLIEANRMLVEAKKQFKNK
jgi:hypothetical protein